MANRIRSIKGWKNLPKQTTKKYFWNIPLPMWLQNVNVLFTMAFTLITGWLAIMTYNTTTEIKGMKEMLKTFSPYIKAYPKSMVSNEDSIYIYVTYKNYGTRLASNIRCTLYFITPDETDKNTFHVLSDEGDIPDDLVSQEPVVSDFSLPILNRTTDELLNLRLAFKVTYTDPLTDNYDSTYTYVVSIPKKDTVGHFKLAKTAEMEEIKGVITKYDTFKRRILSQEPYKGRFR